MKQPQIAFIGAGNMNSAIINGLIINNFPIDQLSVSNRSQEKLDAFSCRTSLNNGTVIENADVIILGVKPQQIKTVCKEIASYCKKNTPLVVSIAAGITLEHIEKYLGYPASIVRAMPNTPVCVGMGSTAMCANQYVSSDQKDISTMIFNSVGMSAWLTNEDLIDPLVSLSGSGPAYIFLMMQAMVESAKKMGLPTQLSTDFCIQTVLGSAALASKEKVSLEKLRKNVTSPGGTTEAAIKTLMHHAFKDIVNEAMTNNLSRSKELAKENKA